MRELRAGKNNVAGEKREEKKARGTRDILTVRHARHAAASDSGTGVERREPCRPGELAVLPRVPQDHRANLDSYSPFAKANPKPSPLLKVRNNSLATPRSRVGLHVQSPHYRCLYRIRSSRVVNPSVGRLEIHELHGRALSYSTNGV